MDKSAMIAEVSRLRTRVNSLEEERDRLQAMIESLSTRVAAQAEMLGRSAEHRGDTAGRVKELEGALGPFAAVLAPGWDRGELSADALYPVRMGDLRTAARALAGTNRAA